MKKLFFLIASLLSLSSFAQSKIELADKAMDEGNYATVIQLTTEHLKDAPKDVKALAMRALAFASQGDDAAALQDANSAIKLWNKKCDIPIGNLYCLRASIYGMMEQYSLVLADYNTAIKKDKKNALCYSSRGEFFYHIEKYAEAEADYRKAYELDSKETEYAIEAVRCMLKQDKNNEAAQILDKIIKYEPQNAEALRLRAVIYFYAGDFTSTIDYYTEYLSLEAGDFDILLLASASEYGYALKTVSAKVRAAKDDNERFFWLGIRSRIYSVKDQYQEALKDLKAMQAMLKDTVVNTFVVYNSAQCYYYMYDFSAAAEQYSILIKEYKKSGKATDHLVSARGFCYEQAGVYDKAIADYTEVIDNHAAGAPLTYGRRGYVKHAMGAPVEDAIEDFNKGLLLDENENTCLILRGKLLITEVHDTLLANRDFEHILQFDTVINNSVYTCRHYALMYLGRNDEAIEWMNKVIEDDPSAGNYYDAACLYARMKRPDESVKYLKTALDMGYRNIRHIETDDDLDSIRERQDYKDLIEKYRKEKIQNIFNKLP